MNEEFLSILSVEALFPNLSETLAAPLLGRAVYPWEVLPFLKDFILELGPTLSKEAYEQMTENVWVSRSARIAPSATLAGPCIIGPETELRPGAFIRGSVLVGAGAVVGNSTELKNGILFNGVQVPHFNYVGDSILGFKSHLGAGSVTSNVKSDKKPVYLHVGNLKCETGLRKLGAILADHVEVGCNSVLNPGTIIGHDSLVYPLSRVRGYLPPEHIFKGEKGIFPRLPDLDF